ncbi:MAG: trehalose-6-phosphate synthase [Methanobacteriaceae archaeon]|jgi:trehalose 6-phosphate synthase
MSQNKTREEIKEFLMDKKLIVASNRGPVEFYLNNGKIEMKRGAGGLVSTLLPFMSEVNGTWVASTMTDGDREVAGKHEKCLVPVPEENPDFHVSFVVVDQEIYKDYYSVISNPLLWFVQHYMWNTPYVPVIDDKMHKAWHDSYVYVNKMFAEKIIEEAKTDERKPLIMLQDYHLYTCPGYIREKLDDIFLSHFIHIPWPQSEYFAILPEYMQEAIVKGLLSNDIIGFHIKKYVMNFLYTSKPYVDKVDYEKGLIWYDGRVISVKHYPISVDDKKLLENSKSSEVFKKEELIRQIKGDCFLIYRTDRADLSKNIIRGFMAYELFLQKHPEFHGKVKFLSTGMPTRQQIKEYCDYKDETFKIIDSINERYSQDGWRPIEQIFKADYNLVTAAFKHYDCLLVNPIVDGMNIVAKEGPVVNENNGVLIMSNGAGSYEELKDNSITVNAYDITQTADAIYRAIMMSLEERKRLIEGLKKTVHERNIYTWMDEQFQDIKQRF